jgi:hypothetical protein
MLFVCNWAGYGFAMTKHTLLLCMHIFFVVHVSIIAWKRIIIHICGWHVKGRSVETGHAPFLRNAHLNS